MVRVKTKLLRLLWAFVEYRRSVTSRWFDPYRPEDKSVTTQEKIRQLAALYLAKAIRSGASEAVQAAVQEHFEIVAANIRRVNPAFIPRNHRVEAALEAASTHGDFGPFHRLLNILEHPYDDQPDCVEFEQPPAPGERVLRTYCGT